MTARAMARRRVARRWEGRRGGVVDSEKAKADAIAGERLGAGTDAAPRAATAQVKWFNATKGFGFIIPHDGSEEIFVHQTGISCAGFRSVWEVRLERKHQPAQPARRGPWRFAFSKWKYER